MSYRPSDSEIYILFLDRALRKRASSAVADFHNTVRDNARRPVSNLFMQARSRFISATRGIHQAPQSGCTYVHLYRVPPADLYRQPRRRREPPSLTYPGAGRFRETPEEGRGSVPKRRVRDNGQREAAGRIILRHNIT